MKSFASKKRIVVGSSGILIVLLAVALFATLNPFSPSRQAHAANPQTDWQAVPLVMQSTLNAGHTGGEGGQVIRALGWSQADPNFLIAGTDVGGIYRSIDGGNHWQSAMVGWKARGSEAFAFDPKNGNRVLGVAGNSLDDPSGNKPNGLYLSTDKGASWTQVLPETTGYANDQSVAYDPTSYNTSLGYCTVAYYATVSNGIYKTTDGGSTWSQVNSGYNNVRIAVSPAKGYVYLTSDINPSYGTAAGFYKSTDGGATFTSKNGNYTSGIAVSPAAPDDVWIARYDYVLVSTDDGETFNITGNTGLPACCTTTFYNVTVSPNNANYLSVAWDGPSYNTERLYSTDGGKTWAQSDYGHYNSNSRQTTNSILPYNVRDGIWAYSPTTANVSFSTGGDWITKSTDGGAHYLWNNDGYNGIFIPTFNFNPNNPSDILMASKDYNSAHSTDGGHSWTYDQTDFDWGGYGFGGFALDSNVMWQGTDTKLDASGDAYLEETTDGGATWTYPQSNGANITVATNANKFDLVSYADPKNGDIGFIGGWRTTDHGKTWSQMSSVTNVYTSNPNNGTLYGGDGTNIYSSSDHGASWSQVTSVSGGFREIAYDQNNNRIWIATRNSLEKYENGSISTVSVPTDQYNNTHVNAVAVDPGNPNIVYVGNDANLWTATNSILRSTDGGSTWENLTVETPLASGSVSGGPHEVWWIEVNPSTHEAWVATNCFGIYKIGAPGSSSSTPTPTPPTPTPTPGGGGSGNTGPIGAPGGKCVDVNGDNSTSGTAVQLWDCNGTSAQAWTVASDGTLRALGKCLDIIGNGTAGGTKVEIWDCNGVGGQQWIPLSNGSLFNPQSNRCLDDPGGNTANGTQLQIWDCNNLSPQVFHLPASPVGPIGAPGGKCVDVAGANSTSGTPVQLWDCNGTSAQAWTVASDGTLRALGKCLDIVGNGTAGGTKVQLWDCNGVGGQQWVPQSNGSLRNPQSGRCLDDPAGNTANGTQLQIWDCNNQSPQVYHLP